MLFGVLVIFGLTLQDCNAYCALLGQNPGFSAAPKVEQISLTSVRVSWEGLVIRRECADQFIVKSWNARNPNDYQMSDLLPVTQFSFTVTDLVPNQNYVFQAVAREDKGILGKDWNKSPHAHFKTTSSNPTVAPRRGRPSARGPAMTGEQRQTPKTLFTMGAIIIGILLGTLILIGIFWNIVQSRRKRSDPGSDHSDSETDSMDLDLENTDLESRVGSMRSPSRAGSRVSTVRSGTIRSSTRSHLRSPRRFSLTLSEPDISGGPRRWSEATNCTPKLFQDYNLTLGGAKQKTLAVPPSYHLGTDSSENTGEEASAPPLQESSSPTGQHRSCKSQKLPYSRPASPPQLPT